MERSRKDENNRPGSGLKLSGIEEEEFGISACSLTAVHFTSVP